MKYQVQLPLLAPAVTLGFSKISGLAQESELIEYREGDESSVQAKIPGLVKTEEVTLERGVARAADYHALVTWRQLTEGLVVPGMVESPAFRCEIQIRVLNRAGNPTYMLTFARAWIRRLEFSDLDANSSEVWLARFVFVHEGMKADPTTLGAATSLAEAFLI
jgi:phage tail-like protein